MKSSKKVPTAWTDVISALFDEVVTMSCLYWQWINGVGCKGFNWLEILALLLCLLIDNNNN
jgi:hypothetical protein